MFDDYAEPGIGDGKIIFAEIARSQTLPGVFSIFLQPMLKRYSNI